MFFQNVNVRSGKWEVWEPQTFFEKIWKNPYDKGQSPVILFPHITKSLYYLLNIFINSN